MGIANTSVRRPHPATPCATAEAEQQPEVSPGLPSPTGSGQHRIHSSGSPLDKPKTYSIASGFTLRQSPNPMNYSHFTELRNLAM